MQIKIGTVRILVFAASVGTLVLSAQPNSSNNNEVQPIDLVEQSHSISTHLYSYERAYALLTLLKNSKEIVSPTEYEKWCLELFEVSHDVSNGWDRVALEKNSLVHLSAVNSSRALKLLKTVENPQPQVDGSFPEDVRADAAYEIFRNSWADQKQSSDKLALLPRIVETARWIKDSQGEYPYAAMGEIAKQLFTLKTAEKDIEAIVREALDAYEKSEYKFTNRNREFASFLKNVKDVVPDPDIRSEAAKAFVNRLLQSPKDMDYQVEFQTPTGNVFVTDDRFALLFGTFPAIRELAPAFATELEGKYPDLRKADPRMIIISGGYVSLVKDPTEAHALHKKAFEVSIVGKIKKISDADLKQATALATYLSDEAMHIQGYTALVPALTKSDAVKAQSVYDTERTRLQELRNPDDHLLGLVSLAQAAYYVKDDPNVSELTVAAIEEGAALFEQDSRVRPDWPPSGRRGFRDLTELVAFGTGHHQALLIDRVQRIQNESLKANLLSIAAKGLSKSVSQK